VRRSQEYSRKALHMPHTGMGKGGPEVTSGRGPAIVITPRSCDSECDLGRRFVSATVLLSKSFPSLARDRWRLGVGKECNEADREML